MKENKQQQYNAYLNNGGTMSMEQWEQDGRYDPGYANARLIASATQLLEENERLLVKPSKKLPNETYTT